MSLTRKEQMMSAWKEMMMAETEEEYRLSRSEWERECREDALRDEYYEGRLIDDEEYDDE